MESPTKSPSYKALLERLAQMWKARDEQNVVATRMDKLVPLFVHARNVEMFMVKETPTACQDLSPTEDERSLQVPHP